MNGTAEPATRGVVMIVLAGALLGIGFNYLGQQSRPARGLEWIAKEKQLDRLEDQIGFAAGTETPGNAPAARGRINADSPAAEVITPDVTRAPNLATAAPAAPGASEASSRPAAPSPPVESESAVADPDDPLGIAVSSAADAGLPEIPDLGRPFQVELSTVKKFFDAGAAYLVDARDVEEFEEGHIPGAVNLPYSTAGTDPARLEAIDPGERPIIIYCGGGTCEVSMSLAETLVYQFAKRKVLVYMGGYPEWESAGYPVRRGKGGEVKG